MDEYLNALRELLEAVENVAGSTAAAYEKLADASHDFLTTVSDIKYGMRKLEQKHVEAQQKQN